jgi:drug/metabolite transporter (DMT)-like permease
MAQADTPADPPVSVDTVRESPRATPAAVRARTPVAAGFGWQDLALILTAVFWGSNFVTLKAAQAMVPIFVFGSMRMTLGAIFVGIILKLSGERMRLARADVPVLLKVAFFGNIVYQFFFLNGLNQTTAANSVLILSASPVLLVLFNWLRGKDRLGRIGLLGAALAFIGVLVVVISRYAGQLAAGDATLLGDALTVIACVIWVFSILVSQQPLERMPVLYFTFWNLVFIALFNYLLALPDALRMNWSTVNPTVFLLVLFSALTATTISSLFWNRGIKRVGPSRTVVYSNLQPIVTAVVANIFLGEPFTVWLVIGTSLVIGGVLLVKRG